MVKECTALSKTYWNLWKVDGLHIEVCLTQRQISQLLLMSSGSEDSDYVTDLKRNLDQARQEIRELLEEKEEVQHKMVTI